jgi:tRNA A37 threonylcarbamoyladenosine biosynthesis protein TsaE
MATTKKDVCSILLGSKTGAMARKQADAVVTSMSDAERKSILDAPGPARKHAWLALTPHVQRLRRDPYYVHAFEDDEFASGRDSLELRDWFASTFKCSPTPVLSPGTAPPRESFAAWRVFQERKHSSKVYIPKSSIRSGMTAMGFAPAAADDALVAAPNGDSLVTHREYSKMQRVIRAFVRDATLVRPNLASTLDLSGLDDTQQKHARGLASAPFACLNGRAGTGKTTLVSTIVSALVQQNVPVICLAPTHRAKKNLAVRLPKNVTLATIDAFVKSSQSEAVKKSKRYVFVDEASMICIVKLARLARATMESAAWQVCLVGDAGQLEPIGRGEMFRTAVGNSGMGVFTLEKCYRAENTDLFDAQTSVRAGNIPPTSASVTVDLFDCDAHVEKRVAEYISTNGADAQFIAWTNKTCDLINRLVQRKVHGKEASKLAPMVGDRVVYVGRNDIRKGLTNAMVGTVDKLVGVSGLIVTWECSGTIECLAKDVALAYCLTVHKAQGSEFPRVCVVATSVFAMTRSLDRRWLYTAVSRAKRQCDLIATRDIQNFVELPVRKREQVGVSFAV